MKEISLHGVATGLLAARSYAAALPLCRKPLLSALTGKPRGIHQSCVPPARRHLCVTPLIPRSLDLKTEFHLHDRTGIVAHIDDHSTFGGADLSVDCVARHVGQRFCRLRLHGMKIRKVKPFLVFRDLPFVDQVEILACHDRMLRAKSNSC